MANPGGTGPEDFTALRDWLSKLRFQDVPADAADKGTPDTAIREPQRPGPSVTLTVAPSGPADFTSVTQAVYGAPAGARIAIRPGRYEEGVVLDKPLELVGDGPSE